MDTHTHTYIYIYKKKKENDNIIQKSLRLRNSGLFDNNDKIIRCLWNTLYSKFLYQLEYNERVLILIRYICLKKGI